MSSTYEHTRSRTLSNKYRPEIDGLRAFAVVAVIINHFNKDLLPSGYLGVDIFFVISGYVITSSLEGRESKNFLDFLTGFYERRIKRLVPALVVFVLITSVLICLFNPDPTRALRTGITSLFGLSNLYLLKQSTDYFAQSTELNPFTHTWSLGVEEQFYLLFPFLIWFTGFSQQTAKGARNLFFWVGALTIASLIGFIYLYQVKQPTAYFFMPTRFWEMATGCLLFIGLQKRVSIEQALEQVPPLLVVAAMVGVMFLPVSEAVTATIGIVVLSVVLIACLKQGTTAYKFFTLEKVVYIGLISYSLYLWHGTVLSISRWTIGIHWWSVPIQIGLMLMMAITSYNWIETPLRKSKWFSKRWKNLSAGVGLLSILSGVLILVGEHLKGKMYLGKMYLGKYPPSDFIYVQDGMECELSGNKPTTKPLECIRGDYRRNTIYIFGNSHSSNLVKSAQNAAKNAGYDNVKYLSNLWKSNGKWTTNWHEDPNIDLILSQTSNKDLIIWSHSTIDTMDKKQHEHIISQLKYLEHLTIRTGVPILIVDDLPSLGSELNFLPKFALFGDGPTTSIKEESKTRKSYTELIKIYVNRNANNYYFDPLPHVCPNGQCRAVIDGVVIYADSSPHFSKKGATILTTPLTNKFLEIKKAEK